MAGQGAILVDEDVLVGDDVGQRGAGLDHGTLHQDTVGHLGALFDDHAAEEDGIFHLALDDTAVSHQRALGDGVGAVIGGGVGLVLGADGTLVVEQVGADGGILQLHGVLVVVTHRLEAGHIAVVDIGHHVQALIISFSPASLDLP